MIASFSENLDLFFGQGNWLGTTSGLTALQVALKVAGVKHGSIVACDPIFPYSALAAANLGAKIYFYDVDIENEFSVELKVGLERHRGIIAEIASAVTIADGNIEKINVEEQNAQLSVISLVVHVQGRRHLARLMRRIRNMKAVISISRVKN